MLQTLFHRSDNGNLYMYDDKTRLSMLTHPNLEQAMNGENMDSYYSEKFNYLKKYGFFGKSKIATFITLDEAIIRENISNTKQIVFEVTDSCNLNCTYCGLGELYNGYDERIQKKINADYAIALLKHVFELKQGHKGSKLFISFYGGEPLLNFEFIEKVVNIIKYLNVNKAFEVIFSMTTNATLLHKYIDFLVVNRFSLLISLDGNKWNHSYRTYVNNRLNSFERVIDNVDMIQMRYPKYFSEKVNFNAVLHDRNSIKDIYEFIYKRYSKTPRISELNRRDIRPNKKDQHEKIFRSKIASEDEFQQSRSELFHLIHSNLVMYKESVNFLKYLSVNYYVSNINALLHSTEMFLPTSTCTPFSKKIFMTNQNKLLPCERVNYNCSLGKVNGDVLIDYKEITRIFNSYYESLKSICQNCYAYRFCGTCLLQFENIDKLGSEEFVCKQYQDIDVFKYKMHKLFSFFEKHPKDFSEIIENIILE